MSINCVIVDDEPKAIEIVERHIEKVKTLKLIGTFTDGRDALDFLDTNPVDLLFVDINMPDLSGTELAILVNGSSKIVFTTAYPEYALKGFEVDAVDYLLKPITFEKFSKAILKLKNYADVNAKLNLHSAAAKKSDDSRIVFFKSGSSLYKTDIDSIKYLEKDGNYFKLITSDKTLLIRMNFAKLSEMLPSNQFVRIHKSYIINLMQIEKIDVDSVTIKNNSLPIGLNFRNDLNHAIEGLVQKIR